MFIGKSPSSRPWPYSHAFHLATIQTIPFVNRGLQFVCYLQTRTYTHMQETTLCGFVSSAHGIKKHQRECMTESMQFCDGCAWIATQILLKCFHNLSTFPMMTSERFIPNGLVIQKCTYRPPDSPWRMDERWCQLCKDRTFSDRKVVQKSLIEIEIEIM